MDGWQQHQMSCQPGWPGTGRGPGSAVASRKRGPAIRVKHFNADATPWEDRDEWVTFPFERSSEEALFFGGLSYELLSPDELRVAVSVGHADGTSEIEELRLFKVIE